MFGQPFTAAAMRVFIACVSLVVAVSASAQPLAGHVGGAGNDTGHVVAVGPDGTVAVGGLYTGTFDGLPGTSGLRPYVATVATSGQRLLTTPIATGSGALTLSNVGLDAAGNLYASGLFSGTADFDPGAGVHTLTSAASRTDLYAASYTPAGALRWAFQIPGTFLENDLDLAVAADGAVAISGTFQGTFDADPGAGSAAASAGTGSFLATYRADGTFGALVPVGGSGNNAFGRSVAMGRAGEAVVTGIFDAALDFDPGPGTAVLTPVGGLDVFVATYTLDGALVSAFALGSNGTDVSTDVAAGPTGTVALVATFMNAVDVDPGPGVTPVIPEAGGDVVASYSAAGSLRWAVATPGALDVRAVAVVGADVVAAGTFTGTADFDPGAGVVSATAANGDGFVVRYSASGEFAAGGAIGGPETDRAEALAASPGGRAVVAGTFSNTLDLDPGAGVLPLVSAGASDAFFAAYTASGSVATGDAGAPDHAAALTLFVSPNPARSAAALSLSTDAPATVDLFDAAGRLVARLAEAARSSRIALPAGLAPGLYVVRATSALGQASARAAVVR